MSAIGYIQVHAYTSRARIPLQDVAITVTAEDGTAIALRLTDRSGMNSTVLLEQKLHMPLLFIDHL